MAHDKAATEDRMTDMTRDMIRMAAARQSAHLIIHELRHYIPEACQREAMDKMLDAFFRDGYELTSIQQRLEMQKIRDALTLNIPKGHLTFPFEEEPKR